MSDGKIDSAESGKGLESKLMMRWLMTYKDERGKLRISERNNLLQTVHKHIPGGGRQGTR